MFPCTFPLLTLDPSSPSSTCFQNGWFHAWSPGVCDRFERCFFSKTVGNFMINVQFKPNNNLLCSFFVKIGFKIKKNSCFPIRLPLRNDAITWRGSSWLDKLSCVGRGKWHENPFKTRNSHKKLYHSWEEDPILLKIIKSTPGKL